MMSCRDAWVYGFSKNDVLAHVSDMVAHFEFELARYREEGCPSDIESFVDNDPTKISWSRDLKNRLKKLQSLDWDKDNLVIGDYRPYCKQWFYQSDRPIISEPGQMLSLFPVGKENVVIDLSKGKKAFSALAVNHVPSRDLNEKGQCFPLYWYEERENLGGLFSENDAQKTRYVRHDAITDEALEVFRAAYPNAYVVNGGRTIEQAKKDGLPSKLANSNERFEVNKVDIFYYVYGILHSPEYRSRFEANLQKELPRIPLSRNFREFCAAGQALAKLHLGYEEIEPWPVKEVGSLLLPGPVQKIKWGKRKDSETGKKVDDHTVLIYNENLVIKDIPEAAQRYTVNGRSPLEWVIDRYQVKTDKASGIVNDPNEYSDDPRYIVDLIEKLIRVSMETMEIVDQLPPVSELPQPANWPFAWKTDA